MDKFLGSVGLGGGLLILVGVRRGLGVAAGGPQAVQALAWIGAALAVPVAGVGVILGYHLLRYPPERRSTAAQIAQAAARQGGPVTRRWR